MSSTEIEIKKISKAIVSDLQNWDFHEIQYKVTQTPRMRGVSRDSGLVDIHFSNLSDDVLEGLSYWLYTRFKKRHIDKCVVNEVNIHLDMITAHEFLNLIKDTQKAQHHMHGYRPDSPLG